MDQFLYTFVTVGIILFVRMNFIKILCYALTKQQKLWDLTWEGETSDAMCSS